MLVASVEGGGLVLSDAQAPGDFEAMLLQARALARGSTGTQRLQAIALLKQIVEGAAERSLTVAALQELGWLAGRGGASDLIPYVEGYAAQDGAAASARAGDPRRRPPGSAATKRRR